MTLGALPGGDLVEAGIADLLRGVVSVEALLVSIGASRLRRTGIDVPAEIPDSEARLYELLAESDPDSAHSRYNALIRRLVSFRTGGGMRRPVDEKRVRGFLHALAMASDSDARVYLTGGATAVLYGWRSSTKDMNLKVVPERDAILRAIPRLKEELEVNVELASPDDFIPELPGWEERSPFIERERGVSFHHYDLSAQALAKIERGHPTDRQDVKEMIARGLIEAAELRRLFLVIEPRLYRYPAIDPKSFRRALEEFLGGEVRP